MASSCCSGVASARMSSSSSADHFELSSLFRCDIDVNGITQFVEFLFQAFVNEGFKVKGSICGISSNFIQYRLSRFIEGIRDGVSQLDIGSRETVLQTILSADSP